MPGKAKKKTAAKKTGSAKQTGAKRRAVRAGGRGGDEAAAAIRCSATLQRPRVEGRPVTWTFLVLPKEASARLPSRAREPVEGTLNGARFRATLDPDGSGGHWLKVDRKLREAAGAEAGDVVTLEIAPSAEEPEPRVPPDLRKALAAAPAKVKEAWSDITARARGDWVQWVESAKQAQTRARRIENACDMLAKGKRRPCCFDRSGMYGGWVGCPEGEGEAEERG